MDANTFKERLQDLNMGLDFGASWDGVGMSMTTLTENRDAAAEEAAGLQVVYLNAVHLKVVVCAAGAGMA